MTTKTQIAAPSADHPFVVVPYTIDRVGRAHQSRITLKVWGYWSHDPINIYINILYTGWLQLVVQQHSQDEH